MRKVGASCARRLPRKSVRGLKRARLRAVRIRYSVSSLKPLARGETKVAGVRKSEFTADVDEIGIASEIGGDGATTKIEGADVESADGVEGPPSSVAPPRPRAAGVGCLDRAGFRVVPPS